MWMTNLMFSGITEIPNNWDGTCSHVPKDNFRDKDVSRGFKNYLFPFQELGWHILVYVRVDVI